jgi:hypothetical protein
VDGAGDDSLVPLALLADVEPDTVARLEQAQAFGGVDLGDLRLDLTQSRGSWSLLQDKIALTASGLADFSPSVASSYSSFRR